MDIKEISQIEITSFKQWFRDIWRLFKKLMTRKITVPVHIAAGFFCGILFPWLPGLSVMLFLTFGAFEWWQAEIDGDEGHLDFWDCLFGVFVGAIVAWILKLVGVV
jgi:hypothetical protein